MRLKLADMPEDVIAHYNLNAIVTPDGYIYCEIQKGMYGLPQAGIFAQQLIEKDKIAQKPRPLQRSRSQRIGSMSAALLIKPESD
jgi:hypothetical protein